MREELLDLLRCPMTGEPLRQAGDRLVAASGEPAYAVTPSGIPRFAEKFLTPDAARQQEHYDKVAEAYLTNLTYPHTQAYVDYLDGALRSAVGGEGLGRVLEVCCGRGEAFHLFGDRVGLGVGVDVSLEMLQVGRKQLPADNLLFVQGDATRLPLADASFDTVFTLGGIHHVNDRVGLFSEVCRVLKPGGRFIWREPVNDFLPWKLLRAVIYRLSPALDADTEHPVQYGDTVPVLEQVGLEAVAWRTYGFLGFCLFMNSDVLVFNRLFRFIPGIRALTRFMAGVDDLTTSLPGLRRAGLQVVGVARKPLGWGSAVAKRMASRLAIS
jgi:SAM-dependent methyltransferase